MGCVFNCRKQLQDIALHPPEVEARRYNLGFLEWEKLHPFLLLQVQASEALRIEVQLLLVSDADHQCGFFLKSSHCTISSSVFLYFLYLICDPRLPPPCFSCLGFLIRRRPVAPASTGWRRFLLKLPWPHLLTILWRFSSPKYYSPPPLPSYFCIFEAPLSNSWGIRVSVMMNRSFCAW